MRLTRVQVGGYLSLSGLALLSQIGDVFDSQWDKLVVARYVGAEAVTALHVGTSLVLQGKVLALLPLAPLMVAVAELRGRDSGDAAEQLQARLMRVGAVAASVVLGGAFLFSPAFIRLWLGDAYDPAGTVARIFVVAVMLNLISAPIAFQAFAEGLHRIAAAAALTNMVVNATMSLLLTMQFGLYGAVYGSIAGNLAGTIIFLPAIRRRVRHWTSPPLLSLAATATVVGTLVLLGWDRFESWWTLLAAGGTFAFLAAALGVRLERLPIRGLYTPRFSDTKEQP